MVEGVNIVKRHTKARSQVRQDGLDCPFSLLIFPGDYLDGITLLNFHSLNPSLLLKSNP